MKHKILGIFILALCLASTTYTWATQISGKPFNAQGAWHGALNVQGQKLPLIFHIAGENNQHLTATLDSPPQGAVGIPIESVTITDNAISIIIKAAGAEFKGNYNSEMTMITGVWKQGLTQLPLALSRNVGLQSKAIAQPLRPQHPKAPFNYKITEVIVTNHKAGIDLAGTLTMPFDDGQFPAVVLITGSGPQDRDQTFMGHKTFWVLADHLTRQGIAVLRLDDRGIGQSEGDFDSATSLDFAKDISSAVQFLAEHTNIDNNKIGLIGHSEGGLIAPITSSMNTKVAFLVMLAGPGKTGNSIAVTQVKNILKANGISELSALAGSTITQKLNQAVMINADRSKLEDELLVTYQKAWSKIPNTAKQELKALGGGQLTKERVHQLSSAWTKYFLAHNPKTYLQSLTVPVLALHGDKDSQMQVDENLLLITNALKNNGHALNQILKVEGVNHLFQHANTGAMSEYAQITETMSMKVLDTVSEWIINVTN